MSCTKNLTSAGAGAGPDDACGTALEAVVSQQPLSAPMGWWSEFVDTVVTAITDETLLVAEDDDELDEVEDAENPEV